MHCDDVWMVTNFLLQSANNQEIGHIEEPALLRSFVNHHPLKQVIVDQKSSPGVVFSLGPIFDDEEMIRDHTTWCHTGILCCDSIGFLVEHIHDFGQFFTQIEGLDHFWRNISNLEERHQPFLFQIWCFVVLNFVYANGGVHR